jgi:hypothetical protein
MIKYLPSICFEFPCLNFFLINAGKRNCSKSNILSQSNENVQGMKVFGEMINEI